VEGELDGMPEGWTLELGSFDGLPIALSPSLVFLTIHILLVIIREPTKFEGFSRAIKHR
jgi:hypothetical protein